MTNMICSMLYAVSHAGDFIGAGVALTGVTLCWFWPRKIWVHRD